MSFAVASVLQQPTPRLSFSALLSIGLHVFVLFGIGFVVPNVKNIPIVSQPLEVVLVNSKSGDRPNDATAYAQSNLEGGGNSEKDLHAKTPFPVLGDGKRFTPEQIAQRLRQLEREHKRLLTRLKSDYSVAQNQTQQQKRDSSGTNGHDLVQRALEIARLEAQVDKSISMYEKLPRRKFLGTRAREYVYAHYEDEFRAKVERIGQLAANYPEALQREPVHGVVFLTVSIRSDGSLESVEVERSSGNRLLDAAAVRIAQLAAPYPPFPSSMRKETDILSIPRHWNFVSGSQLEMN
jgi:periplasmic protein TonB